MSIRRFIFGDERIFETRRPTSIDVINGMINQMMRSGIWPDPNPSAWLRFKILIRWFIDIFFIISILIEMALSIKDFQKLSEVISMFISTFSYLIKSIIFSCKKRKFLKMLQHMEQPNFSSNLKIFDAKIKEAIKETRFVGFLYQTFCFASISLMSTIPLFTKKKSLPLNYSYVRKEYIFPMYVFQISGLVSAAWNNSCIDVLSTGLMNVASTQFYILGEKLTNARKWANLNEEQINNGMEIIDKNITKEIDDGTIVNIVECVKHHNSILDFVNMIENVFTFCFLVQFSDSVIVICFIGFQISTVKIFSSNFIIMVVYFVAMNIQLAIYCWYGNEIMLLSSRVGSAAYNIDWPYCGPRVRKYLFIIMERSQKTVFLTAGKYAQLSLRAFAQIIQSSYSYFALMQHMFREESIN